ncbi:hypothetical protein JX266_001479 [Neoarthrinium moseri]|uniref:uncharacterized protein n=1 Tax=Neoarthrinium moseri TaxID=1658444 RepID=UPI001FDC939E|nr:uncharacterized protein JN550_008638 [Neoarthrinium moseri]KAI1853495.1 hypothetical protein JX266_001479 [Neoarthrinium moseri]KAI1864818.1 hypothetical protein JN550_008638 [Neoarthrinium moseri]
MHTSLFTSGLWLSLVAAKPCSDKTKDEKTIGAYQHPDIPDAIQLQQRSADKLIIFCNNFAQLDHHNVNFHVLIDKPNLHYLFGHELLSLLSIFDKADILFVNSFGIYQHRVISLYPPNYTRNFSIDVTIEHRYNYLNFSVYDDLHLKHNLSIPVRIHPKLTNVVQNPGFEDAGGSLSPWQAGIAIDGDGSDDLAFTGLAQPGSNSSNAVLLHADGPLGGGVISAFVYQTVPTVAGTIYRISYDIAISIAQPDNFYSCGFSGYHDWEAFDYFTLENTQGYRRYTAFFGAAADNQVLKFVVECDSYRGSAEIEIDNVYAVAVE